MQQTKSQDHLPELGQKIADQANRHGVAERFPAPAVQRRLAGDLALIDYDDERLRDVELTIVTAATQHDANPR